MASTATSDFQKSSRGGNIAYDVVALTSLSLISTLFGIRIHTFTNRNAMNFVRYLVAALYLNGMAIMFGLELMLGGIQLGNLTNCRVGIYLCLTFYVLGNKVLMYLFLVERAHAVRAVNHRRHADSIWVVGMICITCGFGSIAIATYVSPAYVKAGVDGCMMGLSRKILIPLLAYDMTIQILLSALFCYFLMRMLRFRTGRREIFPGLAWPSLKGHQPQPAGPSLVAMAQSSNANAATAVLENLMKKTMTGTLLIIIPTIINLAILIWLDGFEPGWLCFSVCSLDVTWSICVLHWLTTQKNDPDFSGAPKRPPLTRDNSALTGAAAKDREADYSSSVWPTPLTSPADGPCYFLTPSRPQLTRDNTQSSLRNQGANMPTARPPISRHDFVLSNHLTEHTPASMIAL